MKKLQILLITLSLMTLTGCLSKEQKEEKKNYEQEAKIAMVEYLENNYNITTVKNVEAKYLGTSPFESTVFSGIVSGEFEKNNITYKIIWKPDENKCYDSFAYKEKIYPILVDYIKDKIHLIGENVIPMPEEIWVTNSSHTYSNILNEDISFFCNYDNVTSFDDIKNYYKMGTSTNDKYLWGGLYLKYNTSNKLFKNNINIFENMCTEDNIFVEVMVNDGGLVSEYLRVYKYNGIKTQYYSNRIEIIGNFTTYWQEEQVPYINYAKESGNFKLELVNNDSYFDERIELYGIKYKIYGNTLLSVKEISGNDDIHKLYIRLNKNVCNKNVIVYYNNLYNNYDKLFTSDYFENGEVKKYALYCEI